MRTALTIAGSDSGGGAGIQADIKTMLANGVYAMSAVTALTAQNTEGVAAIMNSTPDFLAKQLDSIFNDIFPNAVKVGMVSEKELIQVIADKLIEYRPDNIVIDPVMVATSGARLINEDAINILKEKLFHVADLLTPNIPEAEELTGLNVLNDDDMINAAKMIADEYNCAVLLKGGHNDKNANDILYFKGQINWYYEERINNPNTHGTGCTLSSAIAANLAKGYGLEESVKRAKKFVSCALSMMLDLGKGSGPIDHGFAIKNEFTD